MKKVSKIMPVLIIILMTIDNAFAQRPHHKMHDNKGEMQCMQCWKNVSGLTDEQEDKINGLHEDMMDKMDDYRVKLIEKRNDLGDLHRQDEVDMKAINKQIEEIGAIRVAMHKDRAKTHQNIRTLFNKEQREEFDNCAMKMMKRHENCMKDKRMHHKKMQR